jgi:ketosteroid isomerase-like protein
MATETVETRAIDVVERFIETYNAQDFDSLELCLHPNVDFRHYNRGFSFTTAAQLVATLRTFAAEYLPDRVLGPAARLNSVDDVVYREQHWTGTLTTDLLGFGSAGESIDQRLCSVFVVRDGKIVEYYDYG